MTSVFVYCLIQSCLLPRLRRSGLVLKTRLCHSLVRHTNVELLLCYRLTLRPRSVSFLLAFATEKDSAAAGNRMRKVVAIPSPQRLFSPRRVSSPLAFAAGGTLRQRESSNRNYSLLRP